VIQQPNHRYGPGSRDRLALAGTPTADGARAALESFYYALNHRDPDVLAQVWSNHPLVQLNNPLGGILRGHDTVCAVYDRIFRGPLRLRITFSDIVEYLHTTHAVFAGRELGAYTTRDGHDVPLEIRTTRYFRYTDDHRWRQFHHHGSIDDPQALRAYQDAARG